MPNIFLIGFMGSGKTTTARVIARKTGMKLIDIDREIERKQRKKIRTIFRERGEGYFRKIETAELGRAVKKKDAVVATGGGIIKIKENIKAMKRAGTVVYLKNSFRTSAKRLEGKKDRPLFNCADIPRTRRILLGRIPVYKEAADIVVVTDRKKPGDVAAEIMRRTGILK
ncbi:MAG TPA: shikimate kinase [bacterium]|nr:shikimate kinase [bacterium]